MPRLPRLTAAEAEALLSKAGFVSLRSKCSHRIYAKDALSVVVPFHGNETLHLKLAKQVLEAFDELTVAPDITM